MHTFLLLLLLLFVLSGFVRVTSGAASNSYADCLAVAARFATTINGPVANITATAGVNVACASLTRSACPGSIINGVCTWQRKLCVTCINGSTVRIRIQSNGLPGRCASMPSSSTFLEMNVDFEVNFNPDVNVNLPNYSPSTVTDLNSILCNITSSPKIPTASNFVSYSLPVNVTNTLVGLAIDNVAIHKANSAYGVDPFYPTNSYPVELVDQCLGNTGTIGIYHYDIASGCILTPPLGNISACAQIPACSAHIANYSLQNFPLSARNLTVIGIAGDGHVIYGPYTSTGTQVISGVDICNGMFFDSIGNYGYFATTKFPYITACFGPGNYPSFTPSCTTNGPSFYSMSSYAVSFTTTTTTMVTNIINPTGCNNASLVELSNDTCVLIIDAQLSMLTTLRSNQTNATVIAMTLVDYFRVSPVLNASAVNSTLTILEIENLIDSINVDITLNDSYSFIMSQAPTTDPDTDSILGVSFMSHVGGKIVTNTTRINIMNTIFSTAAIITPESLIDMTRFSVVIIDTPSDYRRLNTIENKTLASSVVIASVQRKQNSSTSNSLNISIYFQIQDEYRPNTTAIYYCSFYNLTTASWSESGCTNPPNYNSTFDRYECSCNHLTSFALIWTPSILDSENSNSTSRPSLTSQDIGSLIFELVSIVCFLIIIIHGLFARLINPNLSPNSEDFLPLLSCASTMVLFIFYIALGLTVYTHSENSSQTTCFTSASVLMFVVYFCLLFMFCVKTSVGYFNYLRFVRPLAQSSIRLLTLLLVLSFVIPTIIVSIAIGVNSRSSLNITQLYPYEICWFTPAVIYYFLAIPIGIFLLINTCTIIFVGQKLIGHVRRAPSAELVIERMKYIVLLLLSSCITQGLGWFLGPLLVLLEPKDGDVFAWFFNVCNGLEGLWSILLYIIIRRQRADKISRPLCRKVCSSGP